MQELKVIGVEEGALVAASNDGDRYRIAIDEVALTKLRRLKVEQQESAVRISPREIQAHIRGGLSAEDVAELTGAPLDYVQRFERPIIAEREHIVAQALTVPVRVTADVDVLGESATFGSAIRDRLAALGATGERWASWREEETGWIVKLTFTADDIEHDARWTYEPRKAHLAPANAEASTLSQHGELPPTGLIPRLRAVSPLIPDDARFDSGQFEFVEPKRQDAAPAPAAPASQPQVPAGAIKRADDQPRDVHNTADLLEALRRRRGEREASARDSQPIELELPPLDEGRDARDEKPAQRDEHPSGPVPVPAGGFGQRETGPVGVRGSSKRGRASMPSWDEIVFGARGDDDGGNLA
ncbi:septation protein SepH [Gryllotalpicola daejeonensis]|uniref:Septation protein SepH n=1 Tax=Gryllotalpicola daejeonensis TaxID=993087 RepID=A0ABP7ZF31_9MICO